MIKKSDPFSPLNLTGSEEFDQKITPKTVWKLYEKGVAYNARINLNDIVGRNENFFIGKQWEGVVSNGLPTPVFNVIKRVCCFTVATITSDNIKVQATPLASTPDTAKLVQPIQIMNEELDALTEHNNVPSLMREFCRNAAVDGDGCTFTWWDPDYETGYNAKGAIVTEIIENTRVHFGNPNDRAVQSQPFIIIEKREIIGRVKNEAKKHGAKNIESIGADVDQTNSGEEKETDDKVTTLLLLYKNEDGEVIACKTTKGCVIREPWSLKINLYPVTWLNWDYVQNSFHGQGMVTGLIPNQLFINKSWAMAQLSIMTTAFPKVIYDKTRIAKWDNRVGSAIGVNGGDVNSVAKIIDPATISPQVSEFIAEAVEATERSLGATSVALGDTRPDNTSAIIALQRAASTPSEITKQNLYRSIEDLYRVYVQFIVHYYGKRMVDVQTPKQLENVFQFVEQEVPAEIAVEYDFSELKKLPMKMKLDVGASSYYSEIASLNTLDNLLKLNRITTTQYLERIPDGYIPSRRELILEIKAEEERALREQQMATKGSSGSEDSEEPISGEKPKQEVRGGGGYAALQRKVNEQGTTEGIV